MSTSSPALRLPFEERVNAATHAIGALLSLVALGLLLLQAQSLGGVGRVVSVGVFGLSMVLLYSASTWYHSVLDPRWKRWLRVFDHACIYLLIAGTYTPFTLIGLRGSWGWTLFGIVWGLALAGVVLKVFFVGRWPWLSTAVYLAMGWLAVIATGPVVAALPPGGLLWLIAGGLAYTSGVLFYVWKSLPYHHAIWHCFVLAGTACHFVAVYVYVLPL